MDKDEEMKKIEELIEKFAHLKDYSREEGIAIVKEMLTCKSLAVDMKRRDKDGKPIPGDNVRAMIEDLGIDRVAELMYENLIQNNTQVITMNTKEAKEAIDAVIAGTATEDQKNFVDAMKSKMSDDIFEDVLLALVTGLGYMQDKKWNMINIHYFLTAATIICAMTMEEEIDSSDMPYCESCIQEKTMNVAEEICELVRKNIRDENGKAYNPLFLMTALTNAANLMAIDAGDPHIIDMKKVSSEFRLNTHNNEENAEEVNKDLDFLNADHPVSEDEDSQPAAKKGIKKAKQIKPSNKEMKNFLMDD